MRHFEATLSDLESCGQFLAALRMSSERRVAQGLWNGFARLLDPKEGKRR